MMEIVSNSEMLGSINRLKTFFQIIHTKFELHQSSTHNNIVKQHSKEKETLTPQLAFYDAKQRFFWSIDDSGKQTKDEDFNLPRFRSKDVPQFGEQMEQCGKMMINGCLIVSEMAAIGINIPAESFTSRMQNGPHLLALILACMFDQEMEQKSQLLFQKAIYFFKLVLNLIYQLMDMAPVDIMLYFFTKFIQVIYTEEAKKKYEKNKKVFNLFFHILILMLHYNHQTNFLNQDCNQNIRQLKHLTKSNKNQKPSNQNYEAYIQKICIWLQILKVIYRFFKQGSFIQNFLYFIICNIQNNKIQLKNNQIIYHKFFFLLISG